MKKLLFILGCVVTLSAAKADPPGVHGMVIFGEQLTYLSHLPMFHSPHDYQVVMKVSLVDHPGKDTVLTYKLAKANQPGLYTLVPQVMDLTKVMSGDIKQFTGDIFQGHFEKGGKKIGSVVVAVDKIIIGKKLNPTVQEQNSYLVFGLSGEYYAVHEIQGKPSFDMILKVAGPYSLEFVHCRTRVCTDPKKIPVSDKNLPVALAYTTEMPSLPNESSVLGEFGGIISDVESIIYFEEEELKH